jgi:hypothetical protein
VAVAQGPSEEFVETELLGPCDLDNAVCRRADGDLGHRAGDVVGGHGLDEQGARRTVVPSVAASAMRSTNSKNCVAWTIE